MNDNSVATGAIADRPSTDPERKYFIYRFTYELARLLDCDPQRIIVASLANGSIVANTVFDVTLPGASTDERSPMGLVTLLRRLQEDQSSNMYESSFFRFVNRDTIPPAIPVRECLDGEFRIFCPYTGTIASMPAAIAQWFAAVLGTMLLLALCCNRLWAVDCEPKEKYDEDTLLKLSSDDTRNGVDHHTQKEYARSWLEGRFMGEQWQEARGEPVKAITNGPQQAITNG